MYDENSINCANATFMKYKKKLLYVMLKNGLFNYVWCQMASWYY